MRARARRHSHIRVPNGAIARLMRTTHIRPFRRGGSGFNPGDLFDPENGDDGAFYSFEPGTVFQDSSFTTPANPGDVVGGVLDRSQGGVGDNITSDPTFDTWDDSADGWTAGGGLLTKVPSAAGVDVISPDIIENGKTYQITVALVSDVVGNNVTIRSGGINIGSVPVGTPAGVFKTVVQGVSPNNELRLRGATNMEVTISAVTTEELPGNHVIQATEAAKPIYTRQPVSGVRNLLDASEDFSDVSWSKTRATVDGSKVIATSAAGSHRVFKTVNDIGEHTFSVTAEAGEYPGVEVLLSNGTDGTLSVLVDLRDGSIVSGTGDVADLGGGRYRISVTHTLTVTGTSAIAQIWDGSTVSFTGDDVSGIHLHNAQLEVGTTATAYQSRVSQFDVTEAGVADAYGVTFDGVDDGLATEVAINLSTTQNSTFGSSQRNANTAGSAIVYMMVHGDGFSNGRLYASADNGANHYQFQKLRPVETLSTIYTGAEYADLPDTVALSRVDASVANLVTDLNSDVLTVTGGVENTNNRNNNLHVGKRYGTTGYFTGTIWNAILLNRRTDDDEFDQLKKWFTDRTPGVELPEPVLPAPVAWPVGDAGSAYFDGDTPDAGWAFNDGTGGLTQSMLRIEDGRLHWDYAAGTGVDSGTGAGSAGQANPFVETDVSGDFAFQVQIAASPLSYMDGNFHGYGFTAYEEGGNSSRWELYMTSGDGPAAQVYTNVAGSSEGGNISWPSISRGFPTHLHIQRVGDLFTFSCSFDGINFSSIKSGGFAGFNPTKLGVYAYQIGDSGFPFQGAIDHILALPVDVTRRVTVNDPVTRTPIWQPTLNDLTDFDDQSIRGGSISASAGTLTLSGVGQDMSGARFAWTGTPPADYGVIFKTTTTLSTSSYYLGVQLRAASWRGVDWTDPYGPPIGQLTELHASSSTQRVLSIHQDLDHNVQPDGAFWNFVDQRNIIDPDENLMWHRFEAIGPVMRCRSWIDGNQEPSTWDFEWVDNTVRDAGAFGMALSKNFGSGVADSGTMTITDLELYGVTP